MMRLEHTCSVMIFRRGGCRIESAWLKASGTGFGFEIHCIFGPFLCCSHIFFSLFHDDTRTNMFRHDFFDGAGAGSTQLGSSVQEQVSVSKSVAFSVRFCAVRSFFLPISS